MSNKSPLYKVLELLINEEEDKASALLHDEIIRKARQIHEELQTEEDGVLEDETLDEHEDFDPEAAKSEIKAQEHYGDSVSEEDDDEAELGELGADDMEDAPGAGEMPVGEPGEGEPESLEAEVQDIKDELEDLKRQFEELCGGEEGEGEHGGEMPEEVPAEAGAEAGAEEPEMEPEESVEEGEGGIYGANAGGDEHWEPEEMGKGTGMGDPGHGIYEEESEKDVFEEIDLDEFEDLEESDFAKNPKLIDVNEPTNKEDLIGTGGEHLKPNKDSVLPTDVAKKVEGRLQFTPEPVSKQVEHKGYDLEAAPSVKSVQPKFRNARKTWSEDLDKVAKEGDKSAALNKTESEFSIPKKSTGPISGKMRIKKVD